MASALTPFQTNLTGAQWIDVNPLFTVNNLPDQLPDVQSIQYCSLFNLFNCPIGARSRTFQPEFGSIWYQFIHEPIDNITSEKMQIGMIQSIARWEPRIRLDYSNTYVQADLSIPGYRVRIAFTWSLTGLPQTMTFNVPVKQ